MARISGGSDSDKYPLGYSDFVLDVLGQRAGKAGEVLKKEQDFGSVLALYLPSDADKFYQVWADINVIYVGLKVDEGNCTKWIDEFTEKHKDIDICLMSSNEIDWDKLSGNSGK